jgi:hypothetical protein
MFPLAHEKAFDQETGKPNAAKLKKWFKKEGKLHKDDIMTIVAEASAILRQEPNLLQVASPITGTREENPVGHGPTVISRLCRLVLAPHWHLQVYGVT